MKLVRYDRNGALRLGVIDSEHVVDMLDACPTGTATDVITAMSDMTRFIAAGDAGLTAAAAGIAAARTVGEDVDQAILRHQVSPYAPAPRTR